jgi:mannose-6-phosphate isomerase-like protein (cupin superfamily)
MSQANKLFQAATIILPGGELRADQLEWKAHPTFPGVWMKHLIMGKDTGGSLSCHLVRVEKGKEIGRHVHHGSLELHEVLSGQGVCRMDERDTSYNPGVCMVIPTGANHSVEAHGEDLHLMAKFAPALL